MRSEQPLLSLLFRSVRLYSTKRSASSNKWVNRATRDPYTKAAKFRDYKSRAAFKLIQLDDKFKLFKPGQAVVDLGFAPGAWTQVAVERTSPNGRVIGVDIIPTTPPKGASAIQANILSKKTHIIVRNYFLDPNHDKEKKLGEDDIVDSPSYIASEFSESVERDIDDEQIDETKLKDEEKFPVDLILSDMYEPVIPPYRYWNNTTNSAYVRMANTSGLIVRDHLASINLCDAALIMAIDLLKPGGNFVCKFYTGAEDKGLEKRIGKVFDKVVRFKPDASRSESKECYFVGLKRKKNVDKIEVFS